MRGLRQDLIATVDELRIACDEYLILEAGDAYLQLMCNFDGVYGEAVSNANLEPGSRLTPSDERLLGMLGWCEPDTPCHPWCSGPHPNFHRVWPASTPTEVIADDLLRALVAVYLRVEGQPVALIQGRRVTVASRGAPPAH